MFLIYAINKWFISVVHNVCKELLQVSKEKANNYIGNVKDQEIQ